MKNVENFCYEEKQPVPIRVAVILFLAKKNAVVFWYRNCFSI